MTPATTALRLRTSLRTALPATALQVRTRPRTTLPPATPHPGTPAPPPRRTGTSPGTTAPRAEHGGTAR
ncbi:hypothetical protein [Streptomyces sp. 067-1]|uniref:hypothetical protein n=1 Tax=Streptomyces sp. 067-1 TaxID=2789269 RepID=UPI0039F57F71